MQSASDANGTERHTHWNATDWKQANKVVRNLRQRIFRASQESDLKKVRSLQKLMLRSQSNRLLAVRKVTQTNAGKKSPGVDKVLVKTSTQRGKLVDDLVHYTPWKASPARRVYIPKANGKQRPLGIPTMRDRALQAVVKNALEPFWEARFEAYSFGFRPGRSCHDAVEKLFGILRPVKGSLYWVLDADIKGAFDNISHQHLLETIGGFPAKELVKRWLKAGYMEMGTLHDTEAGTPQGGVISPLLANIALHGMEAFLGIVIKKYSSREQPKGPCRVVRYADDFLVCCKTKEEAQKAKEKLSGWLAKRGLAFSEEKTQIVHITEGVNFLSFHFRQYDSKQAKAGKKLIIKPSKAAVVKMRQTLRREWKALHGHSAEQVLQRLNPLIKGWANYFRTVCSKRTFRALDDFMWRHVYRYVSRQHPKKSWKWKRSHYWGRLNPDREDQWVFGNPRTQRFLWKFQWTRIRRHIPVILTHSPDDPKLREYWAQRMERGMKLLPTGQQKLASKSRGRCRICGEPLLGEIWGLFHTSGEEVQVDHRKAKRHGGADTYANLDMLHLYCHQQKTAYEARKTSYVQDMMEEIARSERERINRMLGLAPES